MSSIPASSASFNSPHLVAVPTHPYDRVFNALVDHACNPKRTGKPNQVRFHCPNRAAHRRGDKRPSGMLTGLSDRAMLHCFAGCPVSAIVRMLGLELKDLFQHGARSVARRRIKSRTVASVYEWLDVHGTVHEKIRYEPKEFCWRCADADAPGGYRWTLGCRLDDLLPYRFDELRDEPIVIKVEGEKAVDALRGLDGLHIPATCGPAGASFWSVAMTERLWLAGCREVVVMSDADQAGRRHAEYVARACSDYMSPTGGRLRVKLVDLFPDRQTGDDIADYLDAGVTADAVLDVIARAPFWTPALAQRQRENRRREQTAARMRRLRQRRAVVRQAVRFAS